MRRRSIRPLKASSPTKLIVYVLTLLATSHGVTTKFDLDPRLTKWADAPRCAAIGELLREDLGDADHVVTYRCDREEDL